jgi:hypothetical protein
MDIRKVIRTLARRDGGIAPGESVTFFPTAGFREGDGWRVPIHGWIYRPAQASRLRRMGLWFARRIASRRAKINSEEMKRFAERAGLFLADNNRRRRIEIVVGEQTWKMKRSQPNGHIQGELRLPSESTGCVDFVAKMPPGDARAFAGHAFLLAERGLSVISDIDDTIKLTGVASRRKVLRSTFLENFAEVPAMAELYRAWQSRREAAFHYVSASPWHLYPLLAEFLQQHRFPEGTFHLRDLRLMLGDLHRTLRPSSRIKLGHARRLMKQYPERRFILVGDSGESDPAIYARLFREFPRRVERILIREAGNNAARTCDALRHVPGERWQLFATPGEIVAAF